MYRAPSLEIVCDFQPPDPDDLIKTYAAETLIPKNVYYGEPWAKRLVDIAGRSSLSMRLDEKGGPSDDLALVAEWHMDKLVGSDRVYSRGSRLLIAAYPIPTQVLAGAVPGLPEIENDSGFRMARKSPKEIEEETRKAIEDGDAWPLDLRPDRAYILASGVLHRMPPKEDITKNRVVLKSHLDYKPQLVAV